MRLHVSIRSERRITEDNFTCDALTGVNGAHVSLHVPNLGERRITAEKLAGDTIATVYGTHVALHVSNMCKSAGT